MAFRISDCGAVLGDHRIFWLDIESLGVKIRRYFAEGTWAVRVYTRLM